MKKSVILTDIAKPFAKDAKLGSASQYPLHILIGYVVQGYKAYNPEL